VSEHEGKDIVWFVNKPAEVSAVSLETLLSTGMWRSPAPAGHAGLLEQMRSGEPIALKSVANRRVGLPFFNADQPVSTMTIYATGKIKQVDADAGTIQVDWTPLGEPRDWYFWTGMRAIWQVRADLNAFSAALVDFTLRGQPQDLDLFLNDPFWAERYPSQPDFSWIGFYTEMASRLASFHRDRTPLVTALAEAARTC
jgi:5-methylcytosine-specific restriction protein B